MAGTGLYYFRARYYKPAIGRFLQPDPSGYTDGSNLYTYVGNNPLAFVDPLGLCKEQPWSTHVTYSAPFPGLALTGGVATTTAAGTVAGTRVAATPVGVYMVAIGATAIVNYYAGSWIYDNVVEPRIDAHFDAFYPEPIVARRKKSSAPSSDIKKKSKGRPGRGHDRKSAPIRKRNWRKSEQNKKDAKAEEEQKKREYWDSLSEEQKKLLRFTPFNPDYKPGQN